MSRSCFARDEAGVTRDDMDYYILGTPSFVRANHSNYYKQKYILFIGITLQADKLSLWGKAETIQLQWFALDKRCLTRAIAWQAKACLSLPNEW